MNKLKNYNEITTEDGSITLFSNLYGEACHSTSGASSETKTHYIEGCHIESLANSQDKIFVLEVGFGAGIGFLETLKITRETDSFLEFVSFEIDPELIEYILNKNEMNFNLTKDFYEVVQKDFRLRVFCGDARYSILKVPKFYQDKFQAIYQDAFSPKRNAILWTTEWFKELKKLVTPSAILSTYSSSSSIRKSLIAAGWKVNKGVKFGPKRSSTRACLIGKTDQDISEHLERSPAIELTDQNYQEYKMDGKNETN